MSEITLKQIRALRLCPTDLMLRGRGTLGRDFVLALLDLAECGLAAQWQPIETAPRDQLIEVYAPAKHGLSAIIDLCQWHPDAGFCVDELREPTLWRPPLHRPVEEPGAMVPEHAMVGVPLFDVIATNIKTGARRLLAEGKDKRNAEAIVRMAVFRRGVEEEFYRAVPVNAPPAEEPSA